MKIDSKIIHADFVKFSNEWNDTIRYNKHIYN